VRRQLVQPGCQYTLMGSPAGAVVGVIACYLLWARNLASRPNLHNRSPKRMCQRRGSTTVAIPARRAWVPLRIGSARFGDAHLALFARRGVAGLVGTRSAPRAFALAGTDNRVRRSMRTILLAGSLCVLTWGAVAQTQGAPSAGAASPGTATVRPSTPPSAPGAGAGPLPTPVPNSANAPSSASGAASPQTSPAGAPAPGAPAGPDPNLPATASGSSNASGQSARTGKNPINERYADCAKLWDAGTHMTKREWLRTCRRIENRLQNLQVENMDVDVSGSKPRRSRKSSPGSG